jgi:hypothetical protein
LEIERAGSRNEPKHRRAIPRAVVHEDAFDFGDRFAMDG